MSHTVTIKGAAGGADTTFHTEGASPTDDGVGESLLVAAMRAGPEIIASGCHGGGCGICRIQIVAGEVRTKRMSRAHVSEQDEAEGVALACRAFAVGDVTVINQRPRGPGFS